jgi:DNA-binding NarL/FixJ family response regulator
MKILIADDHELVRDTIAAFLEGDGRFKIALAEDFDSAAAKIASEGPFDLVLLDYEMPGMFGLQGLARAKEANGGKPVAIMSGVARRSEAEGALEAGAAGFLPKSMPARSLVNAVNFMIAGEQYAPISFMTQEEPAPQHPLAEKLSRREMQVLDGLCRGLSNKEIAREIELEEATIKLHVRTLCRKLDARNRTHAAMIAKEVKLF